MGFSTTTPNRSPDRRNAGRIGIWILMVLLASATVAEAAKGKKARPRPTSTTTDSKKSEQKLETVIDFGESLIEGRQKKPDGFYLLNREPGRFDPMIKVRKNFRDELFRNETRL